MTPQLWTRNLEWPEWRQMHPDLSDQDAEYLYRAELKMFQNYQDEIRNQRINRQNRLTGDLLNLSADISTILNEGGAGLVIYKADYVGFKGQVFENPITGVGVFVGTGTHLFKVGDLFSFNRESAANAQNGIYEVLVETNQTQIANPSLAIFNFTAGLNNNLWKRVATLNGKPI